MLHTSPEVLIDSTGFHFLFLSLNMESYQLGSCQWTGDLITFKAGFFTEPQAVGPVTFLKTENKAESGFVRFVCLFVCIWGVGFFSR